ncbi:MAG: hypothetical protein WC003_00520 [Terrimicrobiaceae bacterium]
MSESATAIAAANLGIIEEHSDFVFMVLEGGNARVSTRVVAFGGGAELAPCDEKLRMED